MLTILMGRAKTGKSEQVLRRIAELGDDGRQILLVPEHASHQAEVDLCRACGPTASRHAEVLSFRRLGDRVLAITGGAAQVTLDAGGRAVIPMDGALDDLTAALTYDLARQAPEGAVAAVQYTYGDRPAGSVYLMASGLTEAAEAQTGRSVLTVSPDEAGEAQTEPSVPIQEPQADVTQTQLTDSIPPSAAQAPSEAVEAPDDGAAREGSATDIRIPANLWAVLGIVISLAAITAIVAAVRIHMRRREEQDLLARRRRRLERLEDIGFSSSDFDQLMAQRRLQSTASRRPRRRPRRRRNKKSFFR